MAASPLSHRHTIGITRREVLQVGYSGLLGIGLSSVLAERVQACPAGGCGGGWGNL